MEGTTSTSRAGQGTQLTGKAGQGKGGNHFGVEWKWRNGVLGLSRRGGAHLSNVPSTTKPP
ncbi:hypothetical protein TIFTF001_015357 [Ficus carica]|uniref:Uncharacterized protein n=1 Tax=Ficus carica TaxID=3494 RepID=A0AA88A119_FICCA|nr:hypothetical protein TIFTF001_015357 [Ficus carica]